MISSPRTPASSIRLAVVAATVLGLATQLTHAAEPLGPKFGRSRLTSSIDTVQGEQDADVFVAPLIEGERLTVSVKPNEGSTLLPEISVVDPDGNVLLGTDIGVKTHKKGKSAKLKKFLIASTGTWGVRITGTAATQGAYTVTTKITPPPTIKLQNRMLDSVTQATRDEVVPGIEGSLFTLKIVWNKKQTAVTVDAIEDPAGDDVDDPVAGLARDSVQQRGKNKLSMKKLPLSVGAGDYIVRPRIAGDGTATYTITMTVAPPLRPKTGKKPAVIGSSEPFLAIVGAPLTGIAGSRIRLNGQGFSGTPVVLFGDQPGLNVSADASGRFLNVDVPVGTDGATVPIAVQNPDGQATRRGDYFLYAPLAGVTDLTDGLGASTRGGATAGTEARRLVGSALSSPLVIKFGDATATVTSYAPDGTSVSFDAPRGDPGLVDVTISDIYSREVTAPFQYEYKAPPEFDASPFYPPFGAVAGGTPTMLSGMNFEAADVFEIDGSAVTLASIDGTSAEFDSPALAAGTYTTRLTDRFGTMVDGPTFVVEAPPTISMVEGVSGQFAAPDEIPLAGGATVRVTGTGFRDSNSVNFNGTIVAASNVTPTTFDFVVPSSTTYGGKLMSVTDLAGQAGSLNNALTYAGYSDATATRAPAGTATDDLGAIRGALGDLDDDGAPDDLALGSYETASYAPGTRTELTRILHAQDGTSLTDVTNVGTTFPAAYSDASGNDRWRADALAIGDIDGIHGDDLVTVGATVGPYGAYIGYNDIRVFADAATDPASQSFNAPGDQVYYVDGYVNIGAGAPYVGQREVVYDSGYAVTVPFFSSTATYGPLGRSTSLAIGDLDDDGDLDAVAGTESYRAGYLTVPLQYVTSTESGNTAIYHGYYYYAQGYSTYQYAPALLIFRNEDASFVDRSFPRLPLPAATGRAFPAADIALGDVDGDDDLDIALTWPDPLSTTPYGLFTTWAYGSSRDSARIAGAILTNDGTGFFTDASATWLPAPAGNEWFQGERLALADLDGDNDLDLVILHELSIDAHTSGGPTFTLHALRILRNDDSPTGFVDVTASALPAVPLPGTLNDNLRGSALRVTDVNGDGQPDILVGTTEALGNGSGGAARSTRLLCGRPGSLTFGLGNDFLPPVTTDTGEANDILVGDIAAGRSDPSVILLTDDPNGSTPGTSPNGELLRVWDWNR